MANPSLHKRQLSVLRHLTNPRYFEGAPGDPGVEGLDPDRLRLMGSLSLGKRIEKIRSALPRSFEYLAHDPRISIGAFVNQFPPETSTRSDNALQFTDYLHGVWCEEPPDPEFLPDLVALELAMAVASASEAEMRAPRRSPFPSGIPRLVPGTQLLRCRFDIRPLFDDSVERTAPIERNICLAVVMPVESENPRVFEVTRDVYAMLNRIRLAEANNSTFATGSGLSRQHLDELVQLGVLEVQE